MFCLNFLYRDQESVTDKARVFGQAYLFSQQFDERMNKGLNRVELDFGCFIIKIALNSRSEETENQVFLLKSMGPGNQNFVILFLVITNNKYVKTLRFISVIVKVHGTNKLKFVMLYCGYY